MARSITFTIDGIVDTLVTVTELEDGSLQFDIKVLGSGSVGDLRALFFDLEGFDTSTSGLTVTSTAEYSGDITDQAYEEGGIDTLGKDANIKGEVSNELGDFDVGIEFGTSGMSEDDIQETSFVLSTTDGSPLSLDMLNLTDFGIRYTSVGEEGGDRSGSEKTGATSAGVAQNDEMQGTNENNSNSALNVLTNDVSLTAPVVTQFTYGGSTYAAGAAATVLISGMVYGTLSVAADGTVTLDATGADVDTLNEDETVPLEFTYTAQSSDGSLATADVSAQIIGVNDKPTLAAGSGNAVEDGSSIIIDLAALGDDADDEDDGSTLIYSVDMGPSEGSAYVSGTDLVFDPGTDFQDLAKDETRDVTVKVKATDARGASTVTTMTVTVTGVNDAPEIDAAASVTTGTVDEDGEDAGTTAMGQLSGSDIDNNASLTWSVLGSGLGNFGELSVDQTGKWTYTLHNDALPVQSLTQEDSFDETFTVAVTDEHGAMETITVTVTVTGSDDAGGIDNSFIGTDYRDNFYGYTGNTEVEGLGANDFLMGDYYYVYTGYSGANNMQVYNHDTGGYQYMPDADLAFGDDVIDAGPGYDTAAGDSHFLFLRAQYSDTSTTTGNDQIKGSGDGDYLYGEGYTFNAYGYFGYESTLYAGNDQVSGDAGNDYASGDAGYAYAYTYYSTTAGDSVALTALGADTVSGGEGSDWVAGDAMWWMTAYTYSYYSPAGSTLTSTVIGGDDNVSGDAGNDTVMGDAYGMQAYDYDYYYNSNQGTAAATVTGGNDAVTGGDGADSVYGDAFYGQAYDYYYSSSSQSNSTSIVSGGNDTVSGGNDGDYIYGDFYRAYSYIYDDEDTARVHGGDDQVSGDSGDDYVYGDFRDVDVRDYSTTGGTASVVAGDDIINGGSGNDHLWGDAQSVYLYGSGTFTTGADVFVFETGSGLDTIYDYELGKDLIDVSGYGISDLSGLAVTNNGTHTTIDFDGTASDIDEVAVLNTVGLDADDFIFA